MSKDIATVIIMQMRLVCNCRVSFVMNVKKKLSWWQKEIFSTSFCPMECCLEMASLGLAAMFAPPSACLCLSLVVAFSGVVGDLERLQPAARLC